MNTPPESFIHYLWMKKLIPAIGLKTLSGKEIQILQYGELNTLGGPDVFNAKLKINNTIWAGNIEIHVNSSDWYNHKHHLDSAYDNVILHVVFNYNKPVCIKNQEIETLELPKEFCRIQYEKYQLFLKKEKDKLPCASFLQSIPNIYIENWKTKLLADRIQSKLKIGANVNDVYNFVWTIVMMNFGLKYNNEPMKIIAMATDFRDLKGKSKSEIDNYFLRQSNLNLPISINENNNIQTEIPSDTYASLSLEWKFGGVRPMNQPIIKLMQFSSFYFISHEALIDYILKGDFQMIERILKEVDIHPYWKTHSSFYKSCKLRNVTLGKSFLNHLKINAFLPLFLHLNKKMYKKDVSQEVFDSYDNLPKESNRIVNAMMNSGFKNKNSFDSQSLIQLNNYYCQSKKCLNCAIGNKIIV